MSELDSPEIYDDEHADLREPWCNNFEGHADLHEFCSDHQAAWCRGCDRQCPDCVHDPHCRWCHCALNEEYHDWDCPCADENFEDEP